ncbi:MAG: hypothetical protein ACREBU_19415 [Nitrososphaera sp.]
MRGDYYLWSDGDNLHIWVADGYDSWDEAIWAVDNDGKRSADRLNASGVSIPEKVMDAFVMVRLAQMIDEGLVGEAIDRAIGECGGNFGSTILTKNAEKLKAALAEIKLDKSE